MMRDNFLLTHLELTGSLGKIEVACHEGLLWPECKVFIKALRGLIAARPITKNNYKENIHVE